MTKYWIGGPDGLGRTAVLLHGAGGSHNLWLDVVRRLPESVSWMALDLPGHGQDPNAPLRSVEALADTVEAFVRERGIRRWLVAGHSLGGAVALTLAGRRSEGLRGLLAVSTGARLPVDRRILDGLTSDFGGTVERIARHVFAKGAPETRLREAARMLSNAGPAALLADFGACADYGLEDEQLQRVGVPTEVLCGEADVLSPPSLSRDLAAGIAGAKLRVVPQCGHMPLLEAPDAVAEALETLWGRTFGVREARG